MPRTRKTPVPAMRELTDTIHIDTSLIPNHVRNRLAAATLDLILSIKADPVLNKRLEERLAAKQAAK